MKEEGSAAPFPQSGYSELRLSHRRRNSSFQTCMAEYLENTQSRSIVHGWMHDSHASMRSKEDCSAKLLEQVKKIYK